MISLSEVSESPVIRTTMTGGRETPQPLSWKVHQIQIFENLRSSSFGGADRKLYYVMVILIEIE